MALSPTNSRDGQGGGSGEVAYAEITADVTVSGTNSATATTIITLPAFTADGVTPYVIEFFSPILANGAAALPSSSYGLTVWAVRPLDNRQVFAAAFCIYVKSAKQTPAAGSRTYSIRGWRSTANATVVARSGTAGDTSEAWARVSTV